MREIKFRAMALGRDGTMQMMYSRDEPNLSQYFSWTDDFEQQQYTGLKDKNGVEIYEGDILGVWVGKGKHHKQLRHEVVWNLYGWMMPSPLGDFEVIGNIYENPELLKGEQ